MVAAISDPPSNIPADLRGRNINVNNVMISLQHDVGKWCTEYNYSAEDSMWGVRFLHNFGRLGTPAEPSEETQSQVKIKRVDEEDTVGGGLRGRVSVGAELYFSAKEKSAGGRSAVLLQPLLFISPS
jgi:distribution and morphology protein 10